MASKILSFLLLCASLARGADYALPSAMQGQWTVGTNTGVTGGIDQYRAGGAEARGAEGGGTTINVTNAPYSADNTGTTDATSAIRTAIVDASPGDLVYIPAGTYRINGAIAIYHDDDEVTVRGAGPGVTILDCRNGTNCFGIGSGDLFTYFSQTVTGTGGSTGSWPKGATVLNVASSADYVAGYLAKVFIGNEEDNSRITAGATIATSTAGYDEVRSHTVRVMAVASGSITIDPPLPIDCANYPVRIALQQNSHIRLVRAGLEDLTITGAVTSDMDAGVILEHSDECWIYNVEVLKCQNYPSKNNDSYRSEIRYNKWEGLGGLGSNGAGILMNSCSSAVVADNIIKDSFPYTEENQGSMNNVWGYNFCTGMSTVMNINHGPHNLLNLYEGNVVQGYQNDGYFGSSSHITFFRNWLHASFGGAQRNAVSQNRFTRNMAHVGNVMGWDGVSIPADSYGNPNLGNGTFVGSAEPSTGDFWADWKMTGPVQASGLTATQAMITVNNPGQLFVEQGGSPGGQDMFNGPSIYWNGKANYRRLNQVIAISGNDVTFGEGPYDAGDNFPAAGTAVVIYAGSNGFQEQDLDTEATTIKVHNYMSSLTTGAVADSTADTLPASLAYTAKPAWFGSLTWPPVNPDSPTFSVEIIPAGYRYINDASPPPSSTAVTVSGNATVGGTLSIGN